MRVVFVPRSAEIKPSFWRFVEKNFLLLPSFLPSFYHLFDRRRRRRRRRKKFSHLPDYILYIKRKNLGLREAHKDFYTHLFFYIKKNK